jgi:hypothetical protein
VKVPAAAFSIACPPPTEPVKLTKPKELRGDQGFGRGMVKDDVLEHILGDACGVEGLGQAFADFQGLAGVFQDHRVARR